MSPSSSARADHPDDREPDRRRQELTIETQDLSQSAGIKQTSAVINPQGTGTLKVDVPQGQYVVSVTGDSIQDAQVKVGSDRESSQDQLLQP